MSTNNLHNISRIVTAIMDERNCDNYTELTEYLGVSNKVISAWMKRNSQSAYKKIVDSCRKQGDLHMIEIAERADKAARSTPSERINNNFDQQPTATKQNEEDGRGDRMKDKLIEFLMEQIRQKDERIKFLETGKSPIAQKRENFI